MIAADWPRVAVPKGRTVPSLNPFTSLLALAQASACVA